MARMLICVALALSAFTSISADGRKAVRVTHVKMEEGTTKLSLSAKGAKKAKAERPRHMYTQATQLPEQKAKATVERGNGAVKVAKKKSGAKAAASNKKRVGVAQNVVASQKSQKDHGAHNEHVLPQRTYRAEDRSGSRGQGFTNVFYSIQRDLQSNGAAAVACVGGMDSSCLLLIGSTFFLFAALTITACRLSRASKPRKQVHPIYCVKSVDLPTQFCARSAPFALQPYTPLHCVKAVDLATSETV